MAIMGALAVLPSCDEGDACELNCPDISGRYAVQETVPQGECAFTPYLIAPTLVLDQTAGGSQVSATLIDPTTQLEVLLSGPVLEPSGEEDEVGRFQLGARVARQATANSDETVTLDLYMTGSVLRAEGEERLSGQFNMIQLEPADGQGCQITLVVLGSRT